MIMSWTTAPFCKGACKRTNSCRGQVRRVWIEQKGWYTDWYCELAIDRARANGVGVVPWRPGDPHDGPRGIYTTQ
jgi:hypothetical protein